MPGQRTEDRYKIVKEAFRQLWENYNPTDLRLYICGAVYAAGQRAGDEVYPREIHAKVIVGDYVSPGELEQMVEGVHKYVIVQDRVRVQYLRIIVHQYVSFLERSAQQALRETGMMN